VQGAKAILDLPKTVEYLETVGVCVLGYKTDTLPAFYTAHSGIPLAYRVESADEVGDAFMARRKLGVWRRAARGGADPGRGRSFRRMRSTKLSRDAVELAEEQGVRGKALTPYLLAQLAEISGGRSVEA